MRRPTLADSSSNFGESGAGEEDGDVVVDADKQEENVDVPVEEEACEYTDPIEERTLEVGDAEARMVFGFEEMLAMLIWAFTLR